MSRIAIASIEELLTRGESRLTPDDILFIEALKSPKRQGEVSAWRNLLRATLHDMGYIDASRSAISYNAVGAPYIEGSTIYIGVSHSSTMVAIIVDTKPCAIDIESIKRDFERVAPRFASPREQLIAPLHTIWAAKETLYKVSGESGLDLLDDISLEIIEAQLIGSVKGVRYLLKPLIVEDHIIVRTL